MAEYLWVESPGTTEDTQATLITARFGDGYQQVAPAGINYIRQVWTVRHAGIEVGIADEIRDFIVPKLGVEAFDWTPPRQSTKLRFICTSHQRTIDEELLTASVTLRFEQDFAP